jgi:hypothetical protein
MPGRALVEDDQPRERREAGEEVGKVRLLPGDLDVRDEPGNQDEIDRAIADDLRGDADVAALRVPGFRPHGVNSSHEV